MNDDRDRDVFPGRPEEEIDAEVDFHVEARTRELIERGLDPAEARRRALERFGQVAPQREAMLRSTIRRRRRSARALLLQDLWQDVAYAFRVLRRSPLFAVTAVLTLALGLGAGDAVSLVPQVREILRGIDPNMPVRITPLESVFSESIARPRFFTTLLAAFATITLTLATIGVFGVMAFTVAQRRREIGVRIAVGADPRRIAWVVARNGLALASLGVAIGALIAIGLGSILDSQLFGVERTDPLTLGAASVILLASAAIGAYAPARAASRTDPVVVLREG